MKTTRAGSGREYKELKDLLSQDEYDTAKGSVLNAHFTSKEVITGIYAALQRFGVRGNNKILEPAVGTGNFFGFMPKEISENARLYGVELDEITGKIATKLYPNANIQIKGFEQTTFSDNQFDIMVSNVPFGNYSVYDSAYARYSFQIHDYFIAKGIDKIKPGGIMAVITSKGTMDKQSASVRKYIADRAELIGAIRLPNTAFKQTAGTEVTSDILFFRKRDEKINATPENTEWLTVGKNEQGLELNSYYISHPEMICGDLAEEAVERQDRLAVRNVEVEGDLLRCGQRMDHIGDGTEPAESVKAVHRLRRIGHTDRHAVAASDAETVQGKCGAVDAGKKLRIARALSEKFIRRVVRVLPCGQRDLLIERGAGIVDAARHIAVKVEPRGFGGERHGKSSSIFLGGNL